MEHVIGFPSLGLEFTVNSIAIPSTIFQGTPLAFLPMKDIYWYGIIIALGVLVATAYISKKTTQFGYEQDHLYDLLMLCLPAAIIGARLYYVLFSWEEYSGEPWRIIATWEGGLAIYGGIIGAIIPIYLYGKRKQLNIPGMLDIAAVGIILGQMFGRWGNFMNAEAHGGVTSLPWGMVIDGAPPVHPTFLYESLWNLIGFILLHFLCKKRHFRGEIFLSYTAWYGLGRFWIEGLRTDSLMITGTPIRVSQVLAGISFLVAAALLVRGRKNKIETLGQLWQPTPMEKPIAVSKKEKNK